MLAESLWMFYLSSSDSFWFVAAGSAGVVIGPFLFFTGFRMLRYKRMILDTPLSKIHSASIGLVEILGTATGPNTLAAPVTGDPCYYYRVQAWQWQESGNKHEWKRVLDESLYLPFFLEDSTGHVLINPQGAEMDVHKSFNDEIGASFFNTRDLLPPNVRNFLVNRGLVPYEKIKVEERIIQPGFPLFVFGTLGDNPASASWSPRPHVAGGGASSFNIQLSAGPGFRITFRRTKTSSQPRLLNKVVTSALGHIPAVQLERSEMQMPAGVPTKSPAAVAVANGDAPANPPAPSFDLHPSVAISKGERGEAFTISWHSQKEVLQSLAWKSTLCIWGGPILGIACLYFLLLYWKFISL
jgi:E3 Ubiquitin ligase